MTGGSLALRSKVLSPQLSSLSRRSLSTFRTPSSKLLRPVSSQRQPSQWHLHISRRSYADESAPPSQAPAASPAPKPKKGFSFIRWTWRLTLLTGLGLTGVLGYSIFNWRHPTDQLPPDPNKKTLVVLGMYIIIIIIIMQMSHRIASHYSHNYF